MKKQSFWKIIIVLLALLLAADGAFLFRRPMIGKLPLLAAAVFLAVLEIVAVIQLRRTGKESSETATRSNMPPLVEEVDIPHRPKHWKEWLPAMVCFGLTFAILLFAMPEPEKPAESSIETQLLSGTVEAKALSTVLTGAGTMQSQKEQEIEIPEGVDVEAVHVRSGEYVKAGTCLATVDKVQAAAELVKLQDLLAELDADLQQEDSKKADEVIKSPASGRVKAIWVQPGDDCEDVISAQGCLMQISLDGKMALEIPAGELKLHETLTISRPEGQTEEGTVVSIADGIAVITLSDEKALPGEICQVTDDQGNALGEAPLYIHSALNILGDYGTVKSVMVKVNDKIWNSGTLLRLENVGHTEEYDTMLEIRSRLESQIAQLLKLSRDGCIYAQENGVVGNLIDADFVELEDPAAVADSMSNSGGWKLMLLSEPTESKDTTVTVLAEAVSVNGETKELSIRMIPAAMVEVFGSSMEGVLSFTYTGSVQKNVDGASEKAELTDIQPGDSLSLTFQKGQDIAVVDVVFTPGNGSGNGSGAEEQKPNAGGQLPGDFGDVLGGLGQSGGATGDLGAMGGFIGLGGLSGLGGLGSFGGGAAASSDSGYESWQDARTTVMTLTPAKTMTVDITVDELDVLTLAAGMEAQLTLDACPEEPLTGIVTKVAAYSTNSGGNTKYTATIEVERTDWMLPGMNASVQIQTAVSGEIPVVPAAALVEQGSRTYLYTGYDAKTDTLTGLTEVVTGLSDGEFVEIRSGLSLGDTYYYRYAGTITYHFIAL